MTGFEKKNNLLLREVRNSIRESRKGSSSRNVPKDLKWTEKNRGIDLRTKQPREM